MCGVEMNRDLVELAPCPRAHGALIVMAWRKKTIEKGLFVLKSYVQTDI